MFFKPIIRSWRGAEPNKGDGIAALARDLGLPVKNVRRWDDLDSIPADWFAAIARAAIDAGSPEITEAHLCAIAERRRLSRAAA